jgi:hypothetical protein
MNECTNCHFIEFLLPDLSEHSDILSILMTQHTLTTMQFYLNSIRFILLLYNEKIKQ